MLLETKNLFKPRQIEVLGDEAWLTKIYGTFDVPKGCEAPQLKASLVVAPAPYQEGAFEVKGQLSYSPYVVCNRCGELFPWPLELTVSGYFAADDLEADDMPDERVNAANEVDIYEFTSQGQIDLESFLNEQIQLAIPLRTVPALDSDHAQNCHQPAENAKIYTTEDGSSSPFAVLAKLRPDKS